VLMVGLSHASGSSTRQLLCIASGLSKITIERTSVAMQVSEVNPMTGLEGRVSLLTSLSQALTSSPQFFGKEGRPGNLIGISPSILRYYNWI